MLYVYILLAIVFTPIVISLLIFLFMLLVYRIKFRKEFKSRPKKQLSSVEYDQPSFFKRVFVLLPKSIIRDLSYRDPDEFSLYGCHCIEGPQGCGKTITMNFLIRKYMSEYPLLRVRTNFDCSFTDDRIHTFADIDNHGNGIYGELDCISELQTWFDCLQSKNFPTSALATITQQRHVHRAILTDTQVFTRTAKQIREQTLSVYSPRTLFGCITFVHHWEPILDDDAKVIGKKHLEFFFFVHDDELRSMYDSYSNVDYGQSILKQEKI